MRHTRTLLVSLAFIGLSAGANAQVTVVDSGDCGASGNNLTWVLTSDSVFTISGTGDMADYDYIQHPTMPELSVYTCPWHGYRSHIKTVVFPIGITSIGACAFWGSNITDTFTVPSTVTHIGARAFAGCVNLTTLNFNAPNCTTLGSYVSGPFGSYYAPAFSGSAITTLNIGSNITIIPNRAFEGLVFLKSVTIPDSIISIGQSAFEACDSLTTLNFNAENCTSVGADCWKNTNITTLNIGNNVKTIPNNAFVGCNFSSVIIPNSVTSIGNYAFYWIDSLLSITIPNSVTTIGLSAFRQCHNLSSVTFGNSITTIPNAAFYECSNLSSITIPNSVTSIGDMAFSVCNLSSITIPDSVTSIGASAFSKCSNMTTINFNAENCTSIGNSCWLGTNILTLNIGNKVTNIPAIAFEYCNNLSSVIIPNSVTTIGNSAFYNCSNLSSITSYAVVPPILGYTVFYGVSNYIPVNVPCGTVNAYQNSSWYYFTNIQSATSGDTINISDTICSNQYYTQNGFNVNTAGTHTRTVLGAGGCDSTIILELSVLPVQYDTINASICAGEYFTENGFNVNTAGTHTLTVAGASPNGCDNIIVLELSILPLQYDTIYASICAGEYYTDNGFNVNTAGTHTRIEAGASPNGCDNIITLILTFNPNGTGTENVTIFDDELPYIWNGKELTMSGTYSDTLTGSNGCDSIATLNLFILYYGCTDVTALNYKPYAVPKNDLCIYAPTENTYNEPLSETPIDTLGTFAVEDCQLNGDSGITSATIIDVTIIDENNVIVHWSVTQGRNTFIYDVEYTITHEGYNLFYLSIVCEEESQDAPKISKPHTKSGDSDIIGYTVSAGYNIVFSENGINDILANSTGIKVYPNPTTNTLNVELAKGVTNGTLTLFDMNGKIVFSQTINGNSAQIDMSSLSAGVYFVKICSELCEVVKKIVKE